MKVRISFTVDVDDDFRRALAQQGGQSGLASRDDIKRHYYATALSTDADIMYDYDPEESDDE